MFCIFFHADSCSRHDEGSRTADSELWDVELPLVFLPLVTERGKGRKLYVPVTVHRE